MGSLASGIFLVFVRLFLPLAERAPRHGGRFPTAAVAIILLLLGALACQLLLAGGLNR